MIIIAELYIEREAEVFSSHYPHTYTQ